MSSGLLEPETAQTPTGGASRMLYLDSLRGTLMLLGIVLHTCARFGSQSEALTGGWAGWSTLGAFIHLWRMPAFFLIAGFFAVMVLSRQGVGRWWSRRLLRLGPPLVFGLLIVNWFLGPARAYRKGRLEGEAVTPHVGQVAHLWFLVYLLVFCSVLAALTWGVRRWRGRPHLRGVAARTMSRPWAVLALLLPVVLVGSWALHLQVSVRVDLIGMRAKVELVPYILCFVVGALLGLAPSALGRLVDRLAWWLVLPALVLPFLLLTPGPTLAAGTWGGSLAVVVAGLAWTFVLLAAFKRYADRGGWPTRYLVDASLPVYLVHFPVIFAVAGLVDAPGVGPVGAGLITMAATMVICFAIYEVLNLTPLTRWLSAGRGELGTSVRELVAGGKSRGHPGGRAASARRDHLHPAPRLGA